MGGNLDAYRYDKLVKKFGTVDIFEKKLSRTIRDMIASSVERAKTNSVVAFKLDRRGELEFTEQLCVDNCTSNGQVKATIRRRIDTETITKKNKMEALRYGKIPNGKESLNTKMGELGVEMDAVTISKLFSKTRSTYDLADSEFSVDRKNILNTIDKINEIQDKKRIRKDTLRYTFIDEKVFRCLFDIESSLLTLMPDDGTLLSFEKDYPKMKYKHNILVAVPSIVMNSMIELGYLGKANRTNGWAPIREADGFKKVKLLSVPEDVAQFMVEYSYRYYLPVDALSGSKLSEEPDLAVEINSLMEKVETNVEETIDLMGWPAMLTVIGYTKADTIFDCGVTAMYDVRVTGNKNSIVALYELQ